MGEGGDGEGVNKSWCSELWDLHRSISHFSSSPHSPGEQIPHCSSSLQSSGKFPKLNLQFFLCSGAADSVTACALFPCQTQSSLCSLCLVSFGAFLLLFFFSFYTYLSHVVCNWEMQLSDLCTRYIKAKRNISGYISGYISGILEVFLIWGYCRVVLII